jgi:hypothetical protein
VTKETQGKKKGSAKGRKGSTVRSAADASDQLLREALAREFIGVCLAALKTYGLSNERLLELAIEAAAEPSGQISSATAVLAEAQRLADTMNKWVEDPAYRDNTGRPSMLCVHDDGGPSFAALAHEFFPKSTVADVVTLGCRANVLERVGAEKVALLNSTVLFTGNSIPVLAYSVRTVRRFLSTTDVNRRVDSAVPQGWPDRTSFVAVSEEDFREFLKIIRPQISGLIEMSNRWLFQRSGLPRNRAKKTKVAGLQVFVFRE